MNIRLAELSDLEEINKLIEAFIDEALSKINIKFNPTHLYNIASSCANSSFVAENDGKIVGIIAGNLSPSVANGELIYQEIMWYVLPEHRSVGVRLIKKVEDYCKVIGVKRIVIAHLANEIGSKVSEFYKRNGYEMMEIHYSKTLEN